MGKVKPTQKPTRDETAINMLRLGQLLHKFSHPKGVFGFSRPIRPDEAERLREEIGALEKRIEEAVADSRQWLLRGVFGLRGRESVDAIAIRIVACVSWSAMVSDRPEAGIASVANSVAMGDWGSHLEARKTIRQLVARGTAIQIGSSDCHGDVLTPNSRLVRFISGDGNLPVLFSAKSIQEEKDDWQRQRQGEVLRKVEPSSRRDGHSPPARASGEHPGLLTARGIYESLKDHVIALDGPLRRFSAQMSLHMRRLEQIRRGIRPSIGPIVTLLIGSSSSGKSWTCECAARLLGLPFSLADMSSVSMSSFCGMDFDTCFYGLLANRTPPSLAQQGLVVLDEIDKLASSKEYAQGIGVQCEALKPLDGCRLVLGGRRANATNLGTLDTYETCFVLAGAFDGIRETLAQMQRESVGLGFGGTRGRKAGDDIRSLLVNFGMMSQVVHRIGAIIVLPDPTPEQIMRITCHSNTGLLAKQNTFLGSFGLRLAPTEEALHHMAKWSCETKGYSRAVKTLLGTLVEEHLCEDRKGDIQISIADMKRAIEETEGANGLKI